MKYSRGYRSLGPLGRLQYVSFKLEIVVADENDHFGCFTAVSYLFIDHIRNQNVSTSTKFSL